MTKTDAETPMTEIYGLANDQGFNITLLKQRLKKVI